MIYMAIVDTGAEPVDVLHITYLVSDDGKQAVEFPEPLVVVIGPGGPGDTYAEVEADTNALTDGKDKLQCAANLRAKLLGWKLQDAACAMNEEQLKAKVLERAQIVKPDKTKTASILIG